MHLWECGNSLPLSFHLGKIHAASIHPPAAIRLSASTAIFVGRASGWPVDILMNDEPRVVRD